MHSLPLALEEEVACPIDALKLSLGVGWPLGGPWDPLSWGPGDGLGDGVLSRFLAGIAGDTLCLFAS